jgi:maltoporin
MFVKSSVSVCDFTDCKYSPEVSGAHVVVKSAVGRWATVMWAGPEYIKEHDIVVLDYCDAVARVEGNNEGYVDF